MIRLPDKYISLVTLIEEQKITNLHNQVEDMRKATNAILLASKRGDQIRQLIDECVIVGGIVCRERQNLKVMSMVT